MRRITIVYKKAQAFVDEQLKIDRRYGRGPKISKEEYDRLVRRVARATPLPSPNGTLIKDHR
jgi:hypothetical protein